MSPYLAQTLNKLDDSTNPISRSPPIRPPLPLSIRQNAWSLPFESPNEHNKKGTISDKTNSDLSMWKSSCYGIIIGVLLASIALAAVLTLWLYRSRSNE